MSDRFAQKQAPHPMQTCTPAQSARTTIGELKMLLDLRHSSRWWSRWAIENAIIAKLNFRFDEIADTVRSSAERDDRGGIR